MLARQRQVDPLFPLSPRCFRPDARTVGSVVSIGVPGALITVLMRVANIV